MASPNSWPAGLAGTGFELATATNDYFSGAVYWLDTVNGNDGNAGTERELPVKTLLQAYTNASAGDTIVIEAGSYESIGTSQAFAKAGLTVLGLGQGANRPRYIAASTIDMFSVTAAGTRLYNLFFPASSAVATSRVKTAAAETEVNGCYFEHGVNDTATGVLVATSGNNCRLIGNTHAVTASRPAIGVSVTGAVTDLYCKDLVFDGGSYGWTDYAFKVSTAAPTRMLVDGLTLTNRSDFGITITGTTYKIFGVNTSGSGRVVIAA